MHFLLTFWNCHIILVYKNKTKLLPSLVRWEDNRNVTPRSELSALEIGKQYFGIAKCPISTIYSIECECDMNEECNEILREDKMVRPFLHAPPRTLRIRKKWKKCRTKEQREGNRNVILWALRWIPRAWELKPSDVASSMITINPRQFFGDVKNDLTFSQQCRERRTNIKKKKCAWIQCFVEWISNSLVNSITLFKNWNPKRNEILWFFVRRSRICFSDLSPSLAATNTTLIHALCALRVNDDENRKMSFSFLLIRRISKFLVRRRKSACNCIHGVRREKPRKR